MSLFKLYNYDIIYKNMFMGQNVLNNLFLVFNGIFKTSCIPIWLPDFWNVVGCKWS